MLHGITDSGALSQPQVSNPFVRYDTILFFSHIKLRCYSNDNNQDSVQNASISNTKPSNCRDTTQARPKEQDIRAKAQTEVLVMIRRYFFITI